MMEVQDMVRNNKGFTLIELLIVVVIIGILAAIAIPKFAGTKSKAYAAAMKSDLKNLVLAEESYFADAVPPGYGNVAANTLTSPTGTVLWTARNKKGACGASDERKWKVQRVGAGEVVTGEARGL